MSNPLTATDFLSNFLSPEYEICPYASQNIRKQDFGEITIDDHFQDDTNSIKAAFDHYINYNYLNETDSDEQIGTDNEEESIEDIEFLDDDQDFSTEIDQNRLNYMKSARPPLKELPENFDSLKDNFKSLIQENLDIFLSFEYYQEQMYYTLSLTGGKQQRQIAKLFNVHPVTVNTHYKRMKTEKSKVGAPSLLSKEEIQIVHNFIHDNYNKENIKTLHSVLHFIYDTFDKIILPDTLVKLLERLNIAQSIIGMPFDQKRAEVRIDDIEEYYSRLTDFFNFHKVLDSFVLNTDESGFQPWANAKAEHVLIPAGISPKQVYYPVKRQQKRCTLVATVVADGSRLNSLIIITRKTIERELYLLGYRPDKGYYYVNQSNGFMTSSIWDFWADEILFPELCKRRQFYNYDGPIVLLIDGCSSHFSEYFLEQCIFYGVFLFIEPPNSSDQLQVLDIGLFGIQKKRKTRIHVKKGLSEQSEEIVKILNSWESVALSSNICSAFEQAGFYKCADEENDQKVYIKVNIQNAVRIRGLETTPVVHGKEYKDRIPVQCFENNEYEDDTDENNE